MEHSIQQQIIDFLLVGGPVVWILMVFSVVALTIVILKLWQFSSLRAESLKTADAALSQWRVKNNLMALETLDSKRPIDSLVAYSMQALLDVGDISVIREEVERRAMKRLSQLRAYLRPLEIIATLSPLLGLLGTVLGMITAFQQMEGAGNQVDPSVLSGGIWQALLTTAVGLAVAIPVVSLHSWLERKVERIAHNMNDAVTQVFTNHKPALATESLGATTASGIADVTDSTTEDAVTDSVEKEVTDRGVKKASDKTEKSKKQVTSKTAKEVVDVA